MKVRYTILPLLFLSLCLMQGRAQVHLDLFGGVSTNSLTLGTDVKSGGTFPLYGIDLEGRLKPRKISRIHVAVAAGASYLANGYNANTSFVLASFFYDARTTNISTKYAQVPFVLRVNWQPTPLVEDFHIFAGLGVVSNWLLEAKLSETSDHVSFSALAAPPTTHYEDSRDVTNLGVRQSYFFRYEFGFRYKKVTLIIRSSISLQDMYYQGLEQVWKIPAASSAYISGHASTGKITERQGDFILSYRLF